MNTKIWIPVGLAISLVGTAANAQNQSFSPGFGNSPFNIGNTLSFGTTGFGQLTGGVFPASTFNQLQQQAALQRQAALQQAALQQQAFLQQQLAVQQQAALQQQLLANQQLGTSQFGTGVGPFAGANGFSALNTGFNGLGGGFTGATGFNNGLTGFNNLANVNGVATVAPAARTLRSYSTPGFTQVTVANQIAARNAMLSQAAAAATLANGNVNSVSNVGFVRGRGFVNPLNGAREMGPGNLYGRGVSPATGSANFLRAAPMRGAVGGRRF